MSDQADNSKPRALAPAGSKLDSATAVVGMIRTLTVPAVAIFLIIAFFQPISEIASILPSKLKEANKVAAGGFLLEVQRSAENAGNPELAQMIGDLSESSLRYLLNAPEGNRYFLSYIPQADGTRHYRMPDKRELAAIAELEAKRLYECEMPINAWRTQFMDVMQPADGPVLGSYRPKSGKEVPAELNTSCAATDAGRSAVNLIITAVGKEIAAARRKAATATADTIAPAQ